MIFENGKEISLEEIAFFGRGAVSEQISCLVTEEIVGFFDDFVGAEMKREIPLIYAVGYRNLQQKQKRMHQLITDGYRLCSFLADNAIVSKNVEIGNGTIINQGVIIDNFVVLNKGCFINIGTTISHHSIVGECVFIGPSATIAGNVKIEKNVFIGANATIINDITIGEGSVVAAGAVVTTDVAPYTLVAGVPATVKKMLSNL